jgi:hypothetical protein
MLMDRIAAAGWSDARIHPAMSPHIAELVARPPGGSAAICVRIWRSAIQVPAPLDDQAKYPCDECRIPVIVRGKYYGKVPSFRNGRQLAAHMTHLHGWIGRV